MCSVKIQASECWDQHERGMANENYHTETAHAKIQKYQYQLGENPSLELPDSSLQDTPPLQIAKTAIRAEYQTCCDCPPIILQYRTLSPQKQQKQAQVYFDDITVKREPSTNQTKNIAKNYGKAIIAFIHKNKKLFRSICRVTATPHLRIMEQLDKIKAILTTVAGFRKIWSVYKYAQCMRVVSNIFLRTKALGYIFNSKVTNYQTHIKYRYKFLRALMDPVNFDHIKEY